MPADGAGAPVLLVSPSAKPGGAERALAGLARRLPELGFSPAAALLDRGPLEGWLEEAGCPIVLRGCPDAGEATVGRLERLVRRTGSKVVVSNKWNGHRRGAPAAAAAGVPAVWWQHDVAEPTPEEVAAASLPVASVVCCSAFVGRVQRRLAPEAPIETIHSGIPVAEVAGWKGSGASVRDSLGWRGNPLVGVVGRLKELKGQEVFIRAAARVADDFPQARFAVVGGAILGTEGTYPARIEQLARDVGLGERIHFAGHRSPVYPWIDALDVVVHASRREPFGLVVVEAMALQRPVVATEAGGHGEIVEHERSGLLVPPERPDEMAAAIGRLLADRELAERLAAEGARRAAAFTEERMARRFARVLRRVLDVPPA